MGMTGSVPLRVLLAGEAAAYYQKAVASAGYEVAVVESGVECLAGLDSLNPDLVVTTLDLGDLSGLQLMKAAQAVRPSVRFILVDDPSFPQQIVAALGEGAVAFVPAGSPAAMLQAAMARVAAQLRPDTADGADGGANSLTVPAGMLPASFGLASPETMPMVAHNPFASVSYPSSAPASPRTHPFAAPTALQTQPAVPPFGQDRTGAYGSYAAPRNAWEATDSPQGWLPPPPSPSNENELVPPLAYASQAYAVESYLEDSAPGREAIGPESLTSEHELLGIPAVQPAPTDEITATRALFAQAVEGQQDAELHAAYAEEVRGQLEEELAALRVELAKAQAELMGAHQTVASAMEQKQAAEMRLMQREPSSGDPGMLQEVAVLRAHLAALEPELSMARAAYGDAIQRALNAEAMLSSIGNQQGQASEWQNRIDTLEAELAGARAAMELASETRTGADTHIQTAEAKAAAANQARDHSEQALKDAWQEIDVLRAEIRRMRGETTLARQGISVSGSSGQSASPDQIREAVEKAVAEIRRLLEAVAPLTWGVEQAAAYIERTAGGVERDTHSRQLRLLLKVLSKLKEKTEQR
jgi:CheY-like chemotaxis protein